MKLEKLLSKIEEDTKEEIDSLQKQQKIDLKKIEEKEKQRLLKVKEDLEKKLAKEREKVLEDYRKDKEFSYEMELLVLKRRLLEETKLQTKESIKDFSFSQKKEILQKKLLENITFSEDKKFTVFVPTGKKKEFASIFNEVSDENIKEKKMDEDGFVIEGERFVYDVNLSLIVDEVVEKESDFFARLLFKE